MKTTTKLGLLIAGLAIYFGTRNKTMSTVDKRSKVVAWVKANVTAGEKVDFTIFDRMSDQELQLIINVLIDKIYSIPLPADILASFNKLSEKYQIFT